MDNRTRNLMMGAAGVESKTYIEDVFSTYLYTGNGSSQTINNGIDLAGKGGLVWTKARGSAYNHELSCTDLAASYFGTQGGLRTNQDVKLAPSDVTGYTSTGFTLGYLTGFGNFSGEKYVSWTFRKAAKFFDVVTWTGDGTSLKAISHSLASQPGFIIVKRTDSTSDWMVDHLAYSLNILGGNPNNQGTLNSTNSFNWVGGNYGPWCYASTSSQFYVGANANVNGATYVAYLFASDAGGFGNSGNDSVVKCGSFSTDGSGNATVSLGWEPQWILVKRSDSTGLWFLLDTLRGWVNPANTSYLQAQDSAAETTGWASGGYPTSTGFYANLVASATYIYIAIRRGPMKTPTDATTVFNTITATASTGTSRTVGFPADTYLARWRGTISSGYWQDRLRGFEDTSGTTTGKPTLIWPNNTNAETNNSFPASYQIWNTTAKDGGQYSGDSTIWYYLRRAPGFFDVVAYTSDGNNSKTISHGLGVKPELMIFKRRNTASSWWIYSSTLSATQYLILNLTSASNPSINAWNDTEPTSSQLTVGLNLNGTSNETWIGYLFASCPGVSKVGSYTGTGTTLQINCGFTNGARFVLIKRTDAAGDWYVWDTARGIVAADDPYLLLNSSAAEVTNTDYIDPYAAGFEISSTAPAAINALNGSYIYLAIA